MAKHIDRNAFLTKERTLYCKNCIRRTNSKGKTVYEIGEAPCRACGIGDVLDDLEDYPAADVVERTCWIPVTERLPEESWERVLAYTDDGTVMTLPAIKLRNGYVRYWMPLPEPPKEG